MGVARVGHKQAKIAVGLRTREALLAYSDQAAADICMVLARGKTVLHPTVPIHVTGQATVHNPRNRYAEV